MSKISRNEPGYSSRNRNKLPALAAIGVLGATVLAGTIGSRGSNDENPSVPNRPAAEAATSTTVVTAVENSNIWNLTEAELRASGKDPSTVEHMGDYVDPNVALNGGNAGIIPGQQVILRDIPNEGPPITEAP